VKILDTEKLLPNPDLLQEVIDSHPFAPPLATVIDTVQVVVSERCGIPSEEINTDLPNRKAVLGLGRSSKDKSTFKFILFHELAHVAVRTQSLLGGGVTEAGEE
jgi:hypothetical protein